MKDFFAAGAKKRWWTSAMILLAVLFFGFGAGRILGSRFVEHVVLGESRFPLLVSRPVGQYIDIYRLLNSDNPFSRLSGYYSLVDTGMVDEEFLMERFRAENLDVIRRTLIWVLGFSEDDGRVMDFFESVYTESDNAMKAEIRRQMKRIDGDRYAEFRRKTGIRNDP